MSDDDEKKENITLEPEEVQAIINWAVSAGAMITILQNAPIHSNTEEALERLEGYVEAIDIIYANMPDCIIEPVHEVASESIDEAERNEEIVNEFRKQIDEL